MRVSFEKGLISARDEERGQSERMVILFLGRFAPLVSSVVIKTETSHHPAEITLQIVVTLRDRQILKSSTSGTELEATLERALARAARSLEAASLQKRKR